IDLKAKEIATVHPKVGKALEPSEIKTAEELSKSVLFATGSAEKVAKEVNFEKEKLVLFVWSGSGQDKITGALVTGEKKVTAQFVFSPGFTKDLRRHFLVFVVPKDAEVKVERAERGK